MFSSPRISYNVIFRDKHIVFPSVILVGFPRVENCYLYGSRPNNRKSLANYIWFLCFFFSYTSKVLFTINFPLCSVQNFSSKQTYSCITLFYCYGVTTVWSQKTKQNGFTSKVLPKISLKIWSGKMLTSSYTSEFGVFMIFIFGKKKTSICHARVPCTQSRSLHMSRTCRSVVVLRRNVLD